MSLKSDTGTMALTKCWATLSKRCFSSTKNPTKNHKKGLSGAHGPNRPLHPHQIILTHRYQPPDFFIQICALFPEKHLISQCYRGKMNGSAPEVTHPQDSNPGPLQWGCSLCTRGAPSNNRASMAPRHRQSHGVCYMCERANCVQNW